MHSFVIVGLALVANTAFAAQQVVPTKTLLVKNPPSGARKVLWKVKETGSAATIVGDPTADGATLRIQLTDGGDQCVSMPALGWSAIGTIGFKYKDSTLTNGPVKVALIKKTPSGTFLVKALLKNGGPTSIAVAPGDPTTTYGTNFTLGVGDDYCGGTATATPNPNDATTFKVSNDGAPAVCITACNATTTTTSTTLPAFTLVQSYTTGCVPYNYQTLDVGQSFPSFQDAYASCALACDSDPDCVQIFVGYEGCAPKTGPYACLTGHDDSIDPTYSWNGGEFQCGLPSPYPGCGDWYNLVP